MKQFLIGCCFFCAVAISSCSSSDTGTGGVTPQTQIVPLGAGFYWIMQTENFDGSGSVTSTKTDTLHIFDDTHLSPKGVTFYHFGDTYVTQKSDGLYNTDLSFNGPYLYLKYPGKVGDIYRDAQFWKDMKFPTALKPDSMVTLGTDYRIASVNALVNVPAGTFNCYQYRTNWLDTKFFVAYQYDDLYFSANVGQVMTEHYERDATNTMKLRSRSKLISMSLK